MRFDGTGWGGGGGGGRGGARGGGGRPTLNLCDQCHRSILVVYAGRRVDGLYVTG